MNIRCLIVDDEPLAVSLISSYIEQVPGLEIAGTCNSAIEAFNILKNKKIDLIFLDIKMPKLKGTDFIRGIANRPKIIFITAYREFALDGYDLDIDDYLLKPVTFNRFLKAVAKTTKQISLEERSLITNWEPEYNRNSFLYFKMEKKMVKVMLNDILYIEARKEYVKLFMESEKSLLIKQPISSLEKMLSSHRFIRVHRSYIAAISKIQSFTSTHITVGGQKIPIGRFYKIQVEKFL